MPSFLSEGTNIHYEDHPGGPAIVLIHGFASNGEVNWVQTGWVQSLTDAGYRVIVPDNRGHGRSGKPLDPKAYHPSIMAEDVINLLDHLDIKIAALIGYSMGARIAAFAALNAPERVGPIVLGGLGINLVEGMSDSAEIIEALLAPTLSGIKHLVGRRFRIFAEHTGSDLPALAACMEGSRATLAPADVARIKAPVLVVIGENDDVAGSGEALVALMPNAELVTVPRRDHMRTTGDPAFKSAALSFLGRHDAAFALV